MDKNIGISLPPEELELEEKEKELGALESELAQKELDLATISAELQALESKYVRIVGAKFLEIDQLNADIAELLAEKQPENETIQEEAKETRRRAEQTARETGDVTEPRKVEAFKPTKELRDLYREVAKKIHPDLARDDKDREFRTKAMAEVNKAYEEGDIERINAILREWETSPEAIEGEDVGSRLVRTIRMIARVQYRLARISDEIRQLMAADLYELKQKFDEAAKEGRDVLEEMAASLDEKIKALKSELKDLQASS